MQGYQDLKKWEVQILKMDRPYTKQLGESLHNKPHEFWSKLTLNQ